MKNKRQAIFFDLDGTLLDTAPDLYRAMNATLEALGKQPITFEKFRPHVHTGTISMLKGSLDITEQDALFETVKAMFLQYYQSQIHQDTDYFPGIPAVLDELDRQHLPWGIVTNKPAYLTDPLIASFQLTQRSCCVISGDTLPQKKPDPAPLLYACTLTQVDPTQAIYIGDTESDIIAAKAARMRSIAVSYGYHDSNAGHPVHWGADYLINNPLEIIDKLKLIL